MALSGQVINLTRINFSDDVMDTQCISDISVVEVQHVKDMIDASSVEGR
jgi:hypothetical protein